MIHRRDNFYIITGCSGAGKSSIIDALRTRGYLCVEEAGREIVKEQMSIGGDGTPWQDSIKFCNLLAQRYVKIFEQVTERRRPVFFDRALPEIVKFPAPDDEVRARRREAAANYRYARTVFVTPPWPEIYRTDAERKHSFDDALEQYGELLDAYRECGYELVEVPKATIPERADFIIRRVGSPD